MDGVFNQANKIIEEKAKKAYMSGDYSEAIKLLSYLLKYDPDNILYMMQLGNCHRKIGNTDKAYLFIVGAEKLDPTDHRPHVLQATMLMEEEDYHGALNTLKIARSKCQSGIPELEDLYSKCKNIVEKEDEDRKQYDQNLEELANDYFNQGAFEQAIQTVNKLIERNPGQNGYIIQSEYYRAQSGISVINDALSNLDALSNKYPNNAYVHKAKAMIYEEIGDTDKAMIERKKEENKR